MRGRRQVPYRYGFESRRLHVYARRKENAESEQQAAQVP
jgi:hypothetical protein